ncbi:MAG: response regulator receiver [Paenibacillaceae bacterium]|jgi:two-component SAPR family response regulator|nr:response regulator receiver [Paenibacillaceae bacterium]
MIKILVVDDEWIALDILEILLGEIEGVALAGKCVQVKEALDTAAAEKPDLIFLDIEMPGMSGLTAFERFKEICPEAEIVFVTAYQQYAVTAFDLSAMDYLLKPVSLERLVRTVERYKSRQGIKMEPVEEPLSQGRGPKVKVLGSLEVYGETGSLLAWRTKKTRELFAFLLHQKGPVYRDRILDSLWPELDLDKAQTLFHTSLYQLRHTLKQGGYGQMVSFADERYMMSHEDLRCDADELEQLLAADRNGKRAAEALALYRGDYLEEESYAWSEMRRYKLRSSFLEYLHHVAGQAKGGRREAVLRKRIELEPYTDSHYRDLLLHLREQGSSAAVDELYRQMRDKYMAELGIEPSLSLEKLLKES